MMASSGCVGCAGIPQLFKPSSTTTPVVVTSTPSVTTPTATPEPTAVARQMSTDVKILPFGEKGLASFDSQPSDDQQYETIEVVIGNDGTADAKDVRLTITETDAHGGNLLVQQTFDVGDLARGDRKDLKVVTDKHDQAGNILIKADLAWGENGEFYNPTTFISITKSVVWMIGYQP
jgi:hypothetical protein